MLTHVVICPAGFYCPTPKNIYPCPKGYYCPTGCVIPRACDLFTDCPEGTRIRKSFIMILVCLLLDAFLICLWLWKRRSESRLDLQIDSHSEDTNYFFSFLDSMGTGSVLDLSFQVENVTCFHPGLGNSIAIIEQLTTRIDGGKMTCIIGPSGSGKTTFLNVLSGRGLGLPYTGKILVNGVDTENIHSNRLFGFVPQDESLPSELTPFELIIHSGRMRLSNVSDANIKRAATGIVDLLNLSRVKNTLFKNLSGGEKKRVSIGIELIAFPSALFLDEPTTGLDSFSALEVVRVLEKLKGFHVTIISVLHSPRIEIFRKFDNAILLANKGLVVYNGSTQLCRPYFDRLGFQFTPGSNEADILSDIICGRAKILNSPNAPSEYSLSDLSARWADRSSLQSLPKSCHFGGGIEELTIYIQKRGAKFLNQLFYSCTLFLKQQFRKFEELCLECASAAFIGWFYGVVMGRLDEPYIGAIKQPFTLLSPAPNLNDIVQMAFIICLTTSFAATPAGVKLFSDEIPFILRNKAAGTSSFAYYFAKTIAALPRVCLASFHYSAFAYYSAPPVFDFTVLYSVIFLIYYNIYGLCSFVSFVITPRNATLLSVIIVIFLGGLSGYGPTFKKALEWNLGWLWQASYNFYAVEALFTETTAVYDHIYDNQVANFIYSFRLGRTAYDFLMMTLIGSIWRVLGFIGLVFLKQKTRRG
jgi:ABC-type multidrug transport system ATPase subunit